MEEFLKIENVYPYHLKVMNVQKTYEDEIIVLTQIVDPIYENYVKVDEYTRTLPGFIMDIKSLKRLAYRDMPHKGDRNLPNLKRYKDCVEVCVPADVYSKEYVEENVIYFNLKK
jgi:hypothetical protein